MIRKIVHKNIDRKKYQNCIQNAINYRIYAEDWYLDIVTEGKWDCLVLGDYEAIMPLPFKRKLGIKYIMQPLFCQQLGVFSPNFLDENKFKQFENKLSKNPVGSYHFNEENTKDFKPIGSIKVNHLLNLNRDYSILHNNFKKDRKKDIRRIEKMDVIIVNDLDKVEFTNELISKYPDFKEFYLSTIFNNLIDELVQRNQVIFYKLLIDNVLVSTAFLIKSKKSTILMFSSRDKSNLYKGSFAFLLNQFIKDNANTDMVLDFEGSMLKNIASFNESFGAEIAEYAVLENSKKELIQNYFNK